MENKRNTFNPRKLLIMMLIIATAITMITGLTSCGFRDKTPNKSGNEASKVYNSAEAYLKDHKGEADVIKKRISDGHNDTKDIHVTTDVKKNNVIIYYTFKTQKTGEQLQYISSQMDKVLSKPQMVALMGNISKSFESIAVNDVVPIAVVRNKDGKEIYRKAYTKDFVTSILGSNFPADK